MSHDGHPTPENPENPESIARAYLAAVGDKDHDRVRALLAADVTFDGPVMSLHGPDEVIEALRRIGAIHVRNDVRRVFVDGDEICVIYDFVTDPPGSLPTIEWLRIRGGLIASVKLYYDQLPWQALRHELAERAARASA